MLTLDRLNWLSSQSYGWKSGTVSNSAAIYGLDMSDLTDLIDYARERAAREACVGLGEKGYRDWGSYTRLNLISGETPGRFEAVMEFDQADHYLWYSGATPTEAYLALRDALEARK